MIVNRHLLPFIILLLTAGDSSANDQHHSSSASWSCQGSSCGQGNNKALKYEVWGSDQSNSVPGETSAGVAGGYLWIWDSDSIANQLETGVNAVPLGCSPDESIVGPCNLLDVFPPDLVQMDNDGNDLVELKDLSRFGRLHGMLKDPFNQYVTVNIFAPQGGYVGVINTDTKEAVGLFCVTKTTGSGDQRSVHMSFWNNDGTAILVDNLNGKMIERIDVIRNPGTGKITDLRFNRSAGVYLGKDWTLLESATTFRGINAFGHDLIGEVVGDYDDADTGDLTPAGACKESGCLNGTGPDNEGGARTNNVPICPIPSRRNNLYVTFGAGGLIVLKLDETPMKIIAEYGNNVVNGAGCGGVENKDYMFMDAGVSAASGGATHSTFSVYAFDDNLYTGKPGDYVQNLPPPIEIFKDTGNTNTLGNTGGAGPSNGSGQLPDSTTRRDSHGAAITVDGKYLHVGDRIQNLIEVFDAKDLTHVSTYDLVSVDGKSGRGGNPGGCTANSVIDDSSLPTNDPAPDLFDMTPDGKYIMVALRGPVPVSVDHSAQGSCPGVGIVELTEGGRSGRLVDVLRSTNMVDSYGPPGIPGGHPYTGFERSDIHHATVIVKKKWTIDV